MAVLRSSEAGGWSRGTTTGATNDSTTSETVRRTRRPSANMSDDDRRKMRENAKYESRREKSING